MSRRGRPRTDHLSRAMRAPRGPAVGRSVRVVRPGHLSRLRHPLPGPAPLRVMRIAGARGPRAAGPARPSLAAPRRGRFHPVRAGPGPDDPAVAPVGPAHRGPLGMAARPPALAPGSVGGYAGCFRPGVGPDRGPDSPESPRRHLVRSGRDRGGGRRDRGPGGLPRLHVTRPGGVRDGGRHRLGSGAGLRQSTTAASLTLDTAGRLNTRGAAWAARGEAERSAHGAAATAWGIRYGPDEHGVQDRARDRDPAVHQPVPAVAGGWG